MLSLSDIDAKCGEGLIEELLSGRLIKKFKGMDRTRGVWPMVSTNFQNYNHYRIVFDYLL